MLVPQMLGTKFFKHGPWPCGRRRPCWPLPAMRLRRQAPTFKPTSFPTAQSLHSRRIRLSSIPGASRSGHSSGLMRRAAASPLSKNANGTKAFAVSVPPAKTTSAHGIPSGTVYNANSSLFPMAGGYAQFLFATLDGTIAGWNTNTPEAVTLVNNSSKGASYTDIVIDKTASASFLLAANFALGTVDVFDNNFAPAQLTGTFSDPGIPSGFSLSASTQSTARFV